MQKNLFLRDIKKLSVPVAKFVEDGFHRICKIELPIDPASDTILIRNHKGDKKKRPIVEIYAVAEFLHATMEDHVQYYRAIEADFERLTRFVHLDLDTNGRTYSLELGRLYLTICAEIDSILKQWCMILDNFRPQDDREWKIEKYVEILSNKRPKFYFTYVVIGEQPCVYPWKVLKEGKVPQWWKDHNGVKHNRYLNYAKANLKNVFYAFAALACLLAALGALKQIDPKSNIFTFVCGMNT